MDSKNFNDFVNQDFTSFADWLFSLNAYEFTLISTAMGFLISPTLTVNQQNSLGNFFELLGQVILTINAQNVTLSQKNKKNSGIISELEAQNIYEELKLIKRELIQLRIDAMGNMK